VIESDAPIDSANLRFHLANRRSGRHGHGLYMSPEQALAKTGRRPTSFRLASFHEMPKPFAFVGGTATDHQQHVREPVAIARFNYNVPEELERIVRKCLEGSGTALPSRELRQTFGTRFATSTRAGTEPNAARKTADRRGRSRRTIDSLRCRCRSMRPTTPTRYLSDGITEHHTISQLPSSDDPVPRPPVQGGHDGSRSPVGGRAAADRRVFQRATS
jgi:hypothetical protein